MKKTNIHKIYGHFMIKINKKTKFVYFFFTIEKTNKTGHYIKINTFLVIHMNYEKIYYARFCFYDIHL